MRPTGEANEFKKALCKRRQTTETTGSWFAQQKSLRLETNLLCLWPDLCVYVEFYHNDRVPTLPSGWRRVKKHVGTSCKLHNLATETGTQKHKGYNNNMILLIKKRHVLMVQGRTSVMTHSNLKFTRLLHLIEKFELPLVSVNDGYQACPWLSW